MTAASPLQAFHRANALTYVSLMAGVAALASALANQPSTAGALIALSVIADTFDGRFARMFERSAHEQAIGVQLDSLSDAIAFGIAPCVCMTRLAPDGPLWMQVLWWGACFAFAACAITRLAFYNVTQDSVEGFIGIPVPVAALVTSSVLLAGPSPFAAAVAMLLVAGAMVIPLRVPRPTGLGLAAFVLWPLGLVVLHAL